MHFVLAEGFELYFMKYFYEIAAVCLEMLSILEILYLVLLDIIRVDLPAKMLSKIDSVWIFIKIVSIPDEEHYSETAVGCTTSYFVKII